MRAGDAALGLLTAATLLIGAGVVGFRRRDVG